MLSYDRPHGYLFKVAFNSAYDTSLKVAYDGATVTSKVAYVGARATSLRWSHRHLNVTFGQGCLRWSQRHLTRLPWLERKRLWLRGLQRNSDCRGDVGSNVGYEGSNAEVTWAPTSN